MNYKLQSLVVVGTSIGILSSITPVSADIAYSGLNLSQTSFLALDRPLVETTAHGQRRNVKDLVPLPPTHSAAQKNKINAAMADHEIWFGKEDGYKIEVIRVYTDLAGNWLGEAAALDNMNITVWKTAMIDGELMWQMVVDSNGMQNDVTTMDALHDLKTRVNDAHRNGDKNADWPLLQVVYGEMTNDKKADRLSAFVIEALDWSASSGKPHLRSFLDFLDKTMQLGNQLLPQLGKANDTPASSIFIATARDRSKQYAYA